jgi:hypothetical protein
MLEIASRRDVSAHALRDPLHAASTAQRYRVSLRLFDVALDVCGPIRGHFEHVSRNAVGLRAKAVLAEHKTAATHDRDYLRIEADAASLVVRDRVHDENVSHRVCHCNTEEVTNARRTVRCSRRASPSVRCGQITIAIADGVLVNGVQPAPIDVAQPVEEIIR